MALFSLCIDVVVVVGFDELATTDERLHALSAVLTVFMNRTMINCEFFVLLSFDGIGAVRGNRIFG